MVIGVVKGHFFQKNKFYFNLSYYYLDNAWHDLVANAITF